MKRLLLACMITTAIIATAYGQTAWVADVTIAWDEAQFATGYTVYVDADSNPLTTEYDVGNVTQFTLTGLLAGDVYTITVRGVNAFGGGPLSDPVGVDLRQPGKPNNNRVIQVEGYKQ